MNRALMRNIIENIFNIKLFRKLLKLLKEDLK